MKKILLLLIILPQIFLAGCLHANPTEPQTASTAIPGGQQIFSIDFSKHALSAEETALSMSGSVEYSTADEAARGNPETTALFSQNGFVKGFSAEYTKLEGQDFRKLVQEAYQFSSGEGAKNFFEKLEFSLALQSDVIRMDVPLLGEDSFGLMGKRSVGSGGSQVKVVDYIIVFRKANIVETIDFFGLEQSAKREEALALAQKALEKIV